MDTMTEITADNLNALAGKLGALELSDEERGVLDRILERASSFTEETVGFVASEDELIAAKGLHEVSLKGVRGGLSPMALKLGTGAGLWG